ncbi:nickel pincer cofactor biosynthesis protein LarC [Haloglycomyces albus]|uniref:nickel pincer cofactor biosynthesis protein LarC n=1 Tax=Haloglycomyces albus TaxID=526067 RepID=UPI0004B38FCC|nr:nickel pincer cofactor biosynthesis protein LarC [Haloglycomyces albus]
MIQSQTIGWIDASAGASGDMFLSVLHDIGVPLRVMQEAIDVLNVDETIELSHSPDSRHGLHGSRVTVTVPASHNDRRWSAIRQLIGNADLADGVRDIALTAFEHLARAEAHVHGMDVDDVHFHEVGALDSIADIVGAAAGIHHLGLDRLRCSTVTTGTGTTRGAHGSIPLPAPAVVAIAHNAGMPITGEVPYEACTPTGAALLAAVVDDFGPTDAMTVTATGTGIGVRDPNERANILRLFTGRPQSQAAARPVVLETNVDDFDPRMWPPALDRILRAGASDAWLSPIVMKKGRSAHTLHVLCRPEVRDRVEETIFHETSTIGLRAWEVEKTAANREFAAVELDGHTVSVKVARWNDKVVNVSVEYEDVVTAAHALDRPVKAVMARANALAERFYSSE